MLRVLCPLVAAALGLTFAAGACMQMDRAAPTSRTGFAHGDAGSAGSAPSTVMPPAIPSDVATTLKDAAAAHEELCTNDGQHPNFPDDADAITRTFCQDKKPGGVMPTPKSLADLLAQLGLAFGGPNGDPAFALLAHSSALTARKVSALAPTAFIFTPPPADGSKPKGYVVLAFDPGEQFVEVASHDPTADVVNFYVVFFEQACTQAPGGCANADLLTPKLTSGWSNLRVYEDTTALNDTIFDCHVCHQPNSKKPPMLRMQEIEPPFTHWMSADTEGGRALFADFHAAHGANQDYGGIPATLIDRSDPSKLAALVTQAGFADQPNKFLSNEIEGELKASAPEQPMVNVPPGKSETWQTLYANAVSGLVIAPPYHDVKVTDPAKLASMTSAYLSFMSGKATSLPDIRDVFLDDGLRDMGFAPKAGASSEELLGQMCGECHNQNLDMTISRENFLVDKLDAMPRAEKDLAITRLKTPVDTRLTMPPPLFRTITDDERQLMIDELSK